MQMRKPSSPLTTTAGQGSREHANAADEDSFPTTTAG
jgi:hypothetical protein